MHFATLLIVALVAQCSNADENGSNSYLNFYEKILTALKKNDIEHELAEDCNDPTGPGPHDMDCLRQWWFDMGCKFGGSHAPDNNPDIDSWQAKTAMDVQFDIEMLAYYADQGHAADVEKCYGTLDCAGASRAGPHDMDCLRQWWSEVGCYPRGSHSPEHKPDLEYWQALTVADVRADMAAFKLYAASDSRYQLDCYG